MAAKNNYASYDAVVTVNGVPVVKVTPGAPAAPAVETSVLYKFGMSPMLWGLVAVGGVGAFLYFKKKGKR